MQLENFLTFCIFSNISDRVLLFTSAKSSRYLLYPSALYFSKSSLLNNHGTSGTSNKSGSLSKYLLIYNSVILSIRYVSIPPTISFNILSTSILGNKSIAKVAEPAPITIPPIAVTTFPILKDNKVIVNSEATKEQFNALTAETQPKLTVTAYAVQYETFEDGAKWKKASANSFFTNTQHSVFVVKGTGTQFGDTGHNFYLGSSDGKLMSVCADNSVEVLDGAVFDAKRFMLMGVRNALVVSNATLNIAKKNDDVALRIGYKLGDLDPDNCVLCLKGENPKINVDVGVSTNACWVQNNSTVRFEIPEEGYARNHVPLSLGGKFQFESGCRLEIDCEKFARAGGGTLMLIETGYNMTEETRNALLAGVRGLPEGSNIKISYRSVKLHCPRGLVISIR